MIRLLLVVLLVAGAAVARADGLEHARAALEAESRRDFDQAIVLYTKAIDAGDLSPKDLTDAFHYRGNANFFLGRFAAAARDYERGLTVDPGNIYPALWLYLARARAGGNAEQELSRNAKKLDLFYWPGSVISLFLGETTPKKVLAAARDPFLPKLAQLDQACEAYFYVGQYFLLRGERDEAVRLFRKALATNATDFVEYDAAKVELERLGG